MIARFCRTVALLFSYIKKTSNLNLVIDNYQYSRGEILKRIYATMARQGKSHEEMRTLFDIKLSDSAIIKECKAPPTYESLQTVANHLDVSLDWLLKGQVVTSKDEAASALYNISMMTAPAIVEKADNCTILQNTYANNIIIHQHFAKVEFAECW